VGLREALADPRLGLAARALTLTAVPWSAWPASTWAPISRSTSRAERRWDWPPTRRQTWSCRGLGALVRRRPAL